MKPNACKKCGEHFITHEGDGSCVEDLPILSKAKLKQQLVQLKQLKKNMKVMHKVYKPDLALAKKIGEVHGNYPTNQVLMRNLSFDKVLNHLDACIESVRKLLLEIKLRRK